MRSTVFLFLVAAFVQQGFGEYSIYKLNRKQAILDNISLEIDDGVSKSEDKIYKDSIKLLENLNPKRQSAQGKIDGNYKESKDQLDLLANPFCTDEARLVKLKTETKKCSEGSEANIKSNAQEAKKSLENIKETSKSIKTSLKNCKKYLLPLSFEICANKEVSKARQTQSKIILEIKKIEKINQNQNEDFANSVELCEQRVMTKQEETNRDIVNKANLCSDINKPTTSGPLATDSTDPPLTETTEQDEKPTEVTTVDDTTTITTTTSTTSTTTVATTSSDRNTTPTTTVDTSTPVAETTSQGITENQTSTETEEPGKSAEESTDDANVSDSDHLKLFTATAPMSMKHWLSNVLGKAQAIKNRIST